MVDNNNFILKALVGIDKTFVVNGARNEVGVDIAEAGEGESCENAHVENGRPVLILFNEVNVGIGLIMIFEDKKPNDGGDEDYDRCDQAVK